MDSKKDLRALLRTKRKALEPGVCAKHSQRIVRLVLGQVSFHGVETVALYWPVGNEVDPRSVARSQLLADCSFALPVTPGLGKALEFRRWVPGDDLVDGAFGEKVPARKELVSPDLLLVPLLGFDRSGHRLGQGGGYYDRTLAKLRQNGPIQAVGLAFSFQECLNVPHEKHDEILDRVVTEEEMILF